MLLIHIQIPARRSPTKTNWIQYQEDLNTWGKINLNGKTKTEIDATLDRFTEFIKKAIEKQTPYISYRTLSHPQLDDEIKININH